MKYPENVLNDLHKVPRTNLVNALSGFKQAMLLGSCDSHGNTNLAMVNSVTHISSKPSIISLLMRTHGIGQTTRRDSLQNILSTNNFTLNHVHTEIVTAAHQTSAKYPADISEFDQTGLTPFYSDAITAPYVAEARIRFGCRFRKLIDMGINQLELVIAEIVEADIPADIIGKEGHVSLSTADSLAVAGCDHYHSTTPIVRYGLARPGSDPDVID